MFPTNLLNDKSTVARLVIPPIEDGIAPLNLLEDKVKLVNLFKFPI